MRGCSLPRVVTALTMGLLWASMSAQTAGLPSREARFTMDSGFVANTDPGSGPKVVFSELVTIPGATWLRLTFSAVSLRGEPGAGNASFLRITSMLDKAVQYQNMEHARQWQFTTAYFNGDSVLIELVAYPGTGPNRVAMKKLIAGLPSMMDDSICGTTDDRQLSNDPRACRYLPAGCSAWMFNDLNKTFCSAGHCGIAANGVCQFNVPLSQPNGNINHPPPEDQYAVEPTSIQYVNGGVGNDWAYFGVYANSNTGLTPFQAQGAAYVLAAQAPPPSGQVIRITGYGTVSAPVSPTWNQVQKTHTGPYVALTGTRVQYAVDTTGGNSGSPVINENTGEVIGVHTHGGCTSTGGANSGTAVQNSGWQTALAAPRGICRSGLATVAPPVYASGDLNNNFGTANIATGAFGKVSEIAALMQGLAYDRNNDVFYGVSNDRKLLTIDPATGTYTVIGTISGTTLVINGLGYDPNTSTLYGIAQSNGQLFRIDTGSAAATTIGPPRGNVVGALDFDPGASKLYGLDDATSGTRLIQINTADGTQTVVGNLGAGITDCNGLAFNPADGQLYTINAGNEQLLRINPATGAATVVGATGGLFGPSFGMAAIHPLVEVRVSSFAVTRGVYLSGSIGDLWISDDSYVRIAQGPAVSTADPSAQMTADGTAPSTTASELRLRVELGTSAVPPNQVQVRTEMYNFQTSSWEVVDQRVATGPDSLFEIALTGTLSRFIEPGTRAIRARLNWLESGTLFTAGWDVRIDVLTWFLRT